MVVYVLFFLLDMMAAAKISIMNYPILRYDYDYDYDYDYNYRTAAEPTPNSILYYATSVSLATYL